MYPYTEMRNQGHTIVEKADTKWATIEPRPTLGSPSSLRM